MNECMKNNVKTLLAKYGYKNLGEGQRVKQLTQHEVLSSDPQNSHNTEHISMFLQSQGA